MRHLAFTLLLIVPTLLFAQADNKPSTKGVKSITIGNGVFTNEQDLKLMVENKLGAYTQGLQILVERKSKNYLEVIDFIMRLFNNDSTKSVQVTSLKDPTPRAYKVPKYLNRVAHLPYESVEVTASDIIYVSDMVLGADGQYHGASAVWLHFKGRGKDGNIMYKDNTRKIFNFHVKLSKSEINGIEKQKWTIFLDDCDAKETLRD